jgi:hypothetical protein
MPLCEIMAANKRLSKSVVAVSRRLHIARAVVQRKLAIERRGIPNVNIVHTASFGLDVFLESDGGRSTNDRGASGRSNDRQKGRNEHLDKGEDPGRSDSLTKEVADEQKRRPTIPASSSTFIPLQTRPPATKQFTAVV